MSRFPFPHTRKLEHLCYPSAANPEHALRAFEAWRREIVTADGARGFLRARRPDTPDGVANSTVSEGIAYGMIIAVLCDQQALFDDFYRYALCFENKSGLMDWYIAPDGSRPLGVGAATDSDEDIAWALVMAHRQWGGRGALAEPYLLCARRQIERVWQCEVDHDRYPDMLLPGDDWRGRNVFNPSYFAPHQYRLFAQVSGNAGWLRVIDRGYEIVFASLNALSGNRDNGLVPAWCTAEGTPVEAFPGALTNYQYDSARLPFRIAQDWASARDPRALEYLKRVSAFFAGIGADGIVDGYTLSGEPAPDPRALRPNPGSAVFVGAAGVGAMHDCQYRTFIDACYERVRSGALLARSRYYNHSWTVLSLLMQSGNFLDFPE
ncbi:MAG TPA: glycosyl hydrolase family 8 [Polyangiaceae bacterium]|nr:glycosyl hydrolase family 8 [Polyangiaceae bacterium]